MPYILNEAREQIDSGLAPRDPGELTYALTSVVLKYLKHTPRFRDYAEAVSALECAKLELYRRMIGPHEDSMSHLNGDVYEF